MCKGRTGVGQNVSNPGRETSTTEEQQGDAILANESPDERAIWEGWARLPRSAQRAIVAAVRAFLADGPPVT